MAFSSRPPRAAEDKAREGDVELAAVESTARSSVRARINQWLLEAVPTTG